jgi:hypothetical protein
MEKQERVMTFRTRNGLTVAIALAVITALAAPATVEAQQTTDSPAAVTIDGNVVTLADGTQVTLLQSDVDALDAALADPDAPDAAQRLQAAMTQVSGGDSARLAAAAAFAVAQDPTFASAIALAAIRASTTPESATLAVVNINNTPGVEPNRVAAACQAAIDLDPEARQACFDGLAVGGPVAGGPPQPLPTLPQQALAGQAIDTTENPAQDNVSPVQ